MSIIDISNVDRIHPLVRSVLSNLAVLAGWNSHDPLEGFCQVALIGKAHRRSHFHKRQSSVQQGLGAVDADLVEVGVRRESELFAEQAAEVKRAEIDAPRKLL